MISDCFYLSVVFISFFAIITSSDASIHDQLRYFETLKVSDLSHAITKRGTQPNKYKTNAVKEVDFKALGKDFRLILSPTKGLLSAHFKAYTVDATGTKKPVYVEQHQFYDGKVFGERDSNVSAHIDEGVMTAAIHLPEETYVVEPSWRHIPEDNNATMIVYRASDVKYSWEHSHGTETESKFCGYVKEEGNSSEHTESDATSEDETSRVVKRQAEIDNPQKRCSLLLVADFRFYENMGGRNLKGTINFLISLIDRVNKVFLDTDWRGADKTSPVHRPWKGMGFVIQEVVVHTEPTEVNPNKDMHYNMAGAPWNVRDLLEVFSRSGSHRWFCLAHLFTDQKFEGGILGLAYVGSPRRNSVGGICSPGYVKNGYTLYLNSGLSTSRNHYGQRVITREADLVTAHEFGHNWGSEHDPDLPECSPDSQRGGSYLMYTYSVSGYDPNNKKFSPCSVRSIKAVLEAKANKCFSKPEESFCGNSLVEEKEECDAGIIGDDSADPCCDKDCRLKKNATCSDKNSPCCRDCHASPEGDVCREAQPTACKEKAKCTGYSAECPPSKPQRDNTTCLDKGKCRAGECIPYCETRGEISCMCDIEINACKRCCRPNHNATCKPTEPHETLRDGTPCIHGYCEKGKCVKTVQDIVERFWDIIEDIDINTVLKFLNDNIVGTVIVVTVLVWIPGSCIISYVDHRRRVEYEKLEKLKRKRESMPPFRIPSDGTTKVVRIARRQPPPPPPPPPPAQENPRHSINGSSTNNRSHGDYWPSYSSERRYETRNYSRSTSGDSIIYGRHDSDYYHSHPHTYSRMGTPGTLSERPSSRTRQPIETYTAL